jgi:ribosomal protein S21
MRRERDPREVGTTVFLQQGEDLESALKRLKKICNDENIFTEIKKREYAIKPSAVRHEKRKTAIRKNKFNLMKRD